MDHQQDHHRHQQQVDFLIDMYKGWLINLQKDAIAEGEVISAEAIADAFAQLRDHYNILDEELDLDAEYKKLLGEEDGI